MDIQISHIIIGSAALIIIFLLILLLHAVSSSSKDKLSELQQKLGAIETAALQMQDIGKEVSSLKSILHAPKIRGNFGEYLLYNLLKDCLPPKNFTTQYHFSDGSAVDAAIRLGKYIVPVDSKIRLRVLNAILAQKTRKAKKRQRRTSKNPLRQESMKSQANTSVRMKALSTLPSCIFPAKTSTTKFSIMTMPRDTSFLTMP